MEHLKKQEAIEILGKFAEGRTSVLEEEQFNAYLKTIDDDQYEELLCTYYELLGDVKQEEDIYGDILEQIKYKAKENGGLKAVAYKMWFRYAAAAIVTIVMGIGFYFYNTADHKELNKRATDGFVTGQNKAVLTLANGEQIILNDASNGEIANQSGITITKSANGQLVYNIDPKVSAKSEHEKETYNTISTPKGGRYQINLPDGTKVWLNAYSSLTYPTHFSASGRKVTLIGEAYFEVAKFVSTRPGDAHKRISFSVRTAQQEVEVLGTHFNVNAYPNETSTKTTLLEGSVKVVAKDNIQRNHVKSEQGEVLQPGEQALLESGKIIVKDVDIAEAVAWKDGYLLFQDEGIRSIMRKIERAYDVEVSYEGPVNDEPIGGQAISKSKTLTDILNILEQTEQFKFKVEGRRITVMP